MNAVEPFEGKALRAMTDRPAGALIVMFDGAVRASKTVASLVMWLWFIRTGPPGNLLMTGRTETTVINNVVLPLQQWLGKRRVVINRGTGQVTILGRTVFLVGANDEQARTKIQGLTLVGAYLDEGTNVPESYFAMLRSRLSVPGAMLIATMNPDGPQHWMLVNWLNRARWWLRADGTRREIMPEGIDADGNELDGQGRTILNIWRVTFVLDDNTFLARNNPGFVRELKASYPRGSVWYRRYILSEWVAPDGAVYADWDEQRMTLTSAQLPKLDRVLMVGLDYGAVHATRGYLLAIATVPHDRSGAPIWDDADTRERAGMRPVLIVLDEFAPAQARVGVQAAQFVTWLRANEALHGPVEWVAIDHAAAVMRLELNELGVSVMSAHKAVMSGIETVASLLTTQRLFVVGDRCPHLVQRIPGYMWDGKATKKGRAEPLKQDDDEVDAARYAIYTSRSMWRDAIPLATVESDREDDADAVA